MVKDDECVEQPFRCQGKPQPCSILSVDSGRSRCCTSLQPCKIIIDDYFVTIANHLDHQDHQQILSPKAGFDAAACKSWAEDEPQSRHHLELAAFVNLPMVILLSLLL